jgi:hypothetical protein
MVGTLVVGTVVIGTLVVGTVVIGTLVVGTLVVGGVFTFGTLAVTVGVLIRARTVGVATFAWTDEGLTIGCTLMDTGMFLPCPECLK